jgi:hypothetical protein
MFYLGTIFTIETLNKTIQPSATLRLIFTLAIRREAFSMTLKGIIETLHKAIANGEMTKRTVETAIKNLSDLGYQYDDERFPALADTENFTDASGETPCNLAEALLWKLGKWKSYKKFSANYMDKDARPTKQDVVFFAFAKHLKDKSNPIYDQHAIRALWAIHGKLTDDESKKCKSLLLDGKSKWKQTGTSSDAIECYELFVKHIDHLVAVSDGVTKGELDRLLMPLGQAIKKETDSYAKFCLLCGWPQNG